MIVVVLGIEYVGTYLAAHGKSAVGKRARSRAGSTKPDRTIGGPRCLEEYAGSTSLTCTFIDFVEIELTDRTLSLERHASTLL